MESSPEHTEPALKASKPGDRLPETLPGDPMHWADAWIKEAAAADLQRNPNSMTIATVDADAQPSARVVLCKAFVPDPGYLVFYTNYRSRKARELAKNARAAAVFHWDSLGRQIRLEGRTVLSPADESDAYFATRDWGSRLGAWASDQSAPIESRTALEEQLRKRAGELGLTLGDDTQSLADDGEPDIPRPQHWGGIRLWPTAVELWVEGRDRIHDRARYTRDIVPASEHHFTVGPWTGMRLQP